MGYVITYKILWHNSPWHITWKMLYCDIPCGEHKCVWDILYIHVWRYSILVWGSYTATFMCQWMRRTTVYAFMCAWMAHACNLYTYVGIYIAIRIELHCAWKPLNIISTYNVTEPAKWIKWAHKILLYVSNLLHHN